MRHSPFLNFCVMSLGTFAVLCQITADSTAAPAKSSTKKGSAASSEKLPAEIPAIPFLTLGLIRDSAIQSELALNPKQIKALEQAIAEVDEPFWRLRDVPVTKCGPELDGLLAKLRKNISLQLTSTQQERFDQILLQARSWKGVIRPDVAGKIKLSSDQVSQMAKSLAKIPQKREALEKELVAKNAAAPDAERIQLKKAEVKSFADVLSGKQQTALSELLGKPFDLDRVTSVGVVAPELRDVAAWINADPIRLQQQRGKVVVVHFWAFGCINCIRNLPHYQDWYEKFSKSDVTIIGIQTPETEAERSLENLKRQVQERKIEYPVVFDAQSANWKAWGNDMWPSVYLIDKQGRVRNWWYGELNWKGATGEEFIRKRIDALVAEKYERNSTSRGLK
jgi:peroxiredoxin